MIRLERFVELFDMTVKFYIPGWRKSCCLITTGICKFCLHLNVYYTSCCLNVLFLFFFRKAAALLIFRLWAI